MDVLAIAFHYLGFAFSQYYIEQETRSGPRIPWADPFDPAAIMAAISFELGIVMRSKEYAMVFLCAATSVIDTRSVPAIYFGYLGLAVSISALLHSNKFVKQFTALLFFAIASSFGKEEHLQERAAQHWLACWAISAICTVAYGVPLMWELRDGKPQIT